MLKIPLLLDDWRLLHPASSIRSGGYERALLQSIFDDAFVLHTLKLLLDSEDPLELDCFTPIEKFLVLTSPDAALNEVTARCLKATSEREIATACLLFTAMADMRAWPRLVQFAKADDVAVQRAGAYVLVNLIANGIALDDEAKAMLNAFRHLEDSHIQELIARADDELSRKP